MIGRQSEIELLEKAYKSEKSEFVALYGRRRVGKTFLIRSVFKNRMTFQLSGLANANMAQQLMNFNLAIGELGARKEIKTPKNWMEALQLLKRIISKSKTRKKVIFIDELPWLDTKKSDFITALEHFWNSWANARTDILLVVCGSAASWMINKLINNQQINDFFLLELHLKGFQHS